MRYIASICLAAALLLSPACRRKDRPRAQATEEEPAGLATIVHMADPRAAAQLMRGFHDVEQNAWRWTMGKFSVALRPPAAALTRGANLVVRFSVPEASIQHLKAITLNTVVNNVALPPETYTKPGAYVYLKEVPAAALLGDAVTVDFTLDKFLVPGTVDQRELGLVVSSIGFEAK